MRLFRLNSFVKDTGRKEDAEAEPERQQWDDPMEFLMSCISMSVGQLPSVIDTYLSMGRIFDIQHFAFHFHRPLFTAPDAETPVVSKFLNQLSLCCVLLSRPADCLLHEAD